ncbi:MAG: hypothetical protein ACJAS9_001516 [Polaribacter sp.]|jgi:hypothetical protein
MWFTNLLRIRLLIVLATFAAFNISCSSTSEANYHGYFFQSQTSDGSPAFSYILYLGDIRDRDSSKNGVGVIVDTRKDERELRASSRPKGDDNEAYSLSFRMEEEAYKRLEIKLEKMQYCKNEVEYTSSEYDWLKYSIKGYCK